jgi:hypothetical protein
LIFKKYGNAIRVFEDFMPEIEITKPPGIQGFSI